MVRSDLPKLNELLSVGAGIVIPGVSNALAARLVAEMKFPAAYVTGAGIANSFLGMPDNGLVTLSELVDHVAAIRDVFPGYLVVDADTGFGSAMNVIRTVRNLERAGANAIQLEDQVFPKRCGHFDGKEVISLGEMVSKIRAAVDTRRDAGLLVIARTDAIATDGFEAAMERAAAFREAGADLTFVEAPGSFSQVAEIPKRLPWPQILNIVVGGRTPEPSNDEVKAMGFAGVLYANVALQSALLGMQKALSHLQDNKRLGDAAAALTASFEVRQRLVAKDHFDALERKYAHTDG